MVITLKYISDDYLIIRLVLLVKEPEKIGKLTGPRWKALSKQLLSQLELQGDLVEVQAGLSYWCGSHTQEFDFYYKRSL